MEHVRKSYEIKARRRGRNAKNKHMVKNEKVEDKKIKP